MPVRAVGMTGCPKSLALMCVAMPTGIVPIGATVSQPARESRPISSTDLPLLLTDGRESVDSSERRRDRFVLEVLLRRTQLEAEHPRTMHSDRKHERLRRHDKSGADRAMPGFALWVGGYVTSVM